MIGTLSLVCLACGSPQKESTSTAPPNILLILADDLGYGDLGVYGQQKIETPNIDKLAQGGMLFTQFYAGSPVCAPSRYMLMTGKHPGHSYIRGNKQREGGIEISDWNFELLKENPEIEGQLSIPDSAVTVAEVLKEAGYQTGIIGKWGLGGPGSEGLPNNQGFDFFYGYLGQVMAHTYYPVFLWKNNERIFLGNDPVTPHTQLADSLDPYDLDSYARFQDQPDYSPTLMLDQAMSFINRSQEHPFFLYYAINIPHVSLQAPQRWVDYYHKKFGEEKPYVGNEGYTPVRYPKATYAAMVSYLDEQVGKLIDKLKKMGEYENTLIIFTSDNGPTYNGGTDSPWFNSAGPFKEERGWAKGFLHEGGIRVPMIAHWPGVIEPGSKTDQLSALWDIMPTLGEVTGAKVPDDTDGISLLSTLKQEDSQQDHPHLYWEFPAYGGQQAVRLGKWKGIRSDILKGDMHFALYNLEKDIKELHNVADEHPKVVKKIKKIMEQEHEVPVLESFRMKALQD